MSRAAVRATHLLAGFSSITRVAVTAAYLHITYAAFIAVIPTLDQCAIIARKSWIANTFSYFITFSLARAVVQAGNLIAGWPVERSNALTNSVGAGPFCSTVLWTKLY
jgi:hypothetical protein